MTTENSNIETLSGLVDLTKTFQAAVNNAGFFTKQKIKKAATMDEAFDLMGDAMGGMMGRMAGALDGFMDSGIDDEPTMGGMAKAMGGMMSGFFKSAADAPAPTEASLKKELKPAETLAGIVQRALSEKKIAKLVPADQRTEANATALKAAGFPQLAKLYTPKS